VRARVIGAAGLLVGALGLTVAIRSGGMARAAPVSTACQVKVGGPLAGTPWAQNRLDFQHAWSITTGQGVVVAVIDTGLDRRHPQLRSVHVAQGVDVISGAPRQHNVRDCDGHGTGVTSIIAAQRVQGVSFAGVAPGATIVPIKQTNTRSDRSGTAAGIARGIEAAIAAHARVANISVTVTTPTAALRAAVTRAARANLVIVAAAGNDGQSDNFAAYPAAYSTRFPNVIAVSASDAQDAIGKFADTGDYVTVAAPGVGVETPAPIQGYLSQDGTSFAAPYVTGAVALVLAAHPELTAAEVRNRIEATADRPPATVPDAHYGYGIVNPYLAVTAIRDDAIAVPNASSAPPLPARAAAPPADQHLAHVALASAVLLLVLAVLAVLAATGAAVLRGARSSTRRGGTTG
jgi:membrane-anchored mycosin MYCP